MNYYKLLLILFLVLFLSIFIYYLFFLKNYLFIQSSFLTLNDFQLLKDYLKDIKIFEENDEKKFNLLDFEKHKNIYDIIYQHPFLKKYIKEHFQKDLIYPSKPIEYRIYKNSSQSMGWHQDIQYLDHPYLECIFILNNSSKCKFQYIKNMSFHSYLQNENDIILLKPCDLIHNIDPIQDNSKEILKCVIDL
ncbi:hypothetical protein HN415_00945 [Candidatus Woesearchaeota archaeon]|nr:hypothetical protein [Candidatus Woesearchaeota archaeon]